MKHLQLQFILASAACGLGALFVFVSLWTVHALPLIGWTPIRIFLVGMMMSLVGVILLKFGIQGVRQELYGKKK